MKRMNNNKLWLWLVALVTLPLVVLAQTNTNTVPVPPGDLPATISQYWDLIISVVTPFLVTGIAKLAPKIPKWVLPAVTPVLGIVLGLIYNKVAGANLGWVDMAKLGALAVFVREVVNQAITKQLLKPSTPTPTA